MAYGAELDPRALGYSLSVVLRIRPAPATRWPSWPGAPRDRGMPSHHRGRLLLMRGWVRDVDHLEELIDRFAVYGQTTTSIVQSSPVPRRGLPLRLYDD